MSEISLGGAVGFVVGLVVMKSLAEPLAVIVGQLFIPPAVAHALMILDRILPLAVADGVDRAELERRLRAEMVKATGNPAWERKSLALVWSRFDARAFVDRWADTLGGGSLTSKSRAMP
jgi:hypothetical protein